MSRSDAIASAVLSEYEQLAANRKPAVRTNGIREWVPLSGIVVECMYLTFFFSFLSVSRRGQRGCTLMGICLLTSDALFCLLDDGKFRCLALA